MEPTMIWAIVRKPLHWVGSKLLGLAGAWTVGPIFRQAHDCHVALRRWQRRWVELADGVEYKLHTRSSFDEGSNAEQSVWIRNTGKDVVDEMRFCVEARLGNFAYQVPLTAYRLRPGSTSRLTLHGLPLQDLTVHEDGIISAYESLHVYPVRIERNHQAEIYSTDGIARHPTYGDYLDGQWKRWNGRLYNLKAISDARRETLFRLAHSFSGQHGFIALDAGTLLAQVLRAKRYRRLPGVLMFALVSRDAVLNVILWTRLLLRIEKIVFECDDATAAATEHVQDKGNGARPVRIVPLQ